MGVPLGSLIRLHDVHLPPLGSTWWKMWANPSQALLTLCAIQQRVLSIANYHSPEIYNRPICHECDGRNFSFFYMSKIIHITNLYKKKKKFLSEFRPSVFVKNFLTLSKMKLTNVSSSNNDYMASQKNQKFHNVWMEEKLNGAQAVSVHLDIVELIVVSLNCIMGVDIFMDTIPATKFQHCRLGIQT